MSLDLMVTEARRLDRQRDWRGSEIKLKGGEWDFVAFRNAIKECTRRNDWREGKKGRVLFIRAHVLVFCMRRRFE